MTRTNPLKKALAGLMAFALVATTIVAAPFTFDSNQTVEAAPIEALTAAASYTFDDASSVSGLEAVGASVVTDETKGSVLMVETNASGKNYLRIDNPLYGQTAGSATVSMDVKLIGAADQWMGLFGFMNNTTGGFFGMSSNGCIHFNAYSSPNVYYDTTDAVIDATGWHNVVMSVYSTGTIETYVDGALAATYSPREGDEVLATYLTQQQYIYLGVDGNFWNTTGAYYDNVSVYQGVYSLPVASYSFDDAESISGLEAVGAAIATDETKGSVLQVDTNAAGKNYLRLDNPVYGKDAGDVTVSMDVKLIGAADQWMGLFGFMNNTTGGFFGVSSNGCVHFNAYSSPNVYYDTTDAVIDATGWHNVALKVTTTGYVYTYVDGTLAATYEPREGDEVLATYLTQQQYIYLGVDGNFWNTTGAYYDNVAVYYDEAASSDDDEPEEPIDTAVPYLISKTGSEEKWQVVDSDSNQANTKSIYTYAAGQSSYSIYGWFYLNGYSNNMFLFQQQSTSADYYGLRVTTDGSGHLKMWLCNDQVDTSWVVEDCTLPKKTAFFYCVNYDGVNHKISVTIDGTEVWTLENTEQVIAASSYAMNQIRLGTSQWGDPVLNGRVSGLYYSNALMTDEEIAAKVAAGAPDLDATIGAATIIKAERENLNIVDTAEGTTVTYDETSTDSNGNKAITSVVGEAKAMLSNEKYTSQNLSTKTNVEGEDGAWAGYREFDTSAFLANADDFTITGWTKWSGSDTSSWSSGQTITAQRFFDLFNIDKESQSAYEFYFNPWQEDQTSRNPSISTEEEMKNAEEEMAAGKSLADYEEAAYLTGIAAGATLNGQDRPCFKPGLTWAANNSSPSSNLPYSWSAVAVVYDADGHLDSNGNVIGAKLTYYLDGNAYAYRYYDYEDNDDSAQQYYQGGANGYYTSDVYSPESTSNALVGGSADGADIIYGMDSAEAFKVKNMALDTLWLGKSTDSSSFFNAQYQNVYLYNYALTTDEVGTDYLDFVKPYNGTTENDVETARPASSAENKLTIDGTVYSLITDEDEFSKTMTLGFNTAWTNTAKLRDNDAITFKGDGGYMEVPIDYLKDSTGAISDTMTFSAWINIKDTVDWARIFDIKGTTGQVLLANNGYFNNDADIGLGLRSATLNAKTGKEIKKVDVTNGMGLTEGNWINVAVVIDGTTVTLYSQGYAVASGSMACKLSEMGLVDEDGNATGTFYISRSASVDGKYKLPLDSDNNFVMDECYLIQQALTDEQIQALGYYGYTGAAVSSIEEDNTRIEMMDVESLFSETANEDNLTIDIDSSKILSADVMNALANSEGKTLYVRIKQGSSYDFVWKLTSEAFAAAGKTFGDTDEFDLMISGGDMSSTDKDTLLNKMAAADPFGTVVLKAQSIELAADKLPVALELYINYARDFLGNDGTTLTDTALNLYKGTASSYSALTLGLPAVTDAEGQTVLQDYTYNDASGNVIMYYKQSVSEGGSYILTPNTLP